MILNLQDLEAQINSTIYTNGNELITGNQLQQILINMVESFWNSEKDYKEGNDFVIGGAAFKAGIMLYGPPGSGKSCTIKLVTQKLVERGGIVFNSSNHSAQMVCTKRRPRLKMKDAPEIIHHF